MSNSTLYNSRWTQEYFDTLGEKEAGRLFKTAADRISFEMHKHYLEKFVPPQSRVLEIGAGPGVFTEVLALLGCSVSVCDISEVQLGLNRERAERLGYRSQITEWRQVDISDLSVYESGAFDVVLAYSGPISYVFDRAEIALKECARVAGAGKLVIASVMSLWGTIHRFLPGVLDVSLESNRRIIESGDLHPTNHEGADHLCRMYRAEGIQDLYRTCGIDPLAVSASNFLSINWDTYLAEKSTPEQWATLVDMELSATRDPGCLNSGNHIIVVGQVE